MRNEQAPHELGAIRLPLREKLNLFFKEEERQIADGRNTLFILSDAGMGKSSFLMMLKLNHVLKLWPTDTEFVLHKLGESSIDFIKGIQGRHRTVLLLDALDEDPAAWGRHKFLRSAGDGSLEGSRFAKANLRGADLSGVDLSGVDLSKADLSGADLSRADLSRADLSEANLRKANLIEVDLIGANLSEANLNAAILNRANLRGANLRRADLSEAHLKLANFSGADLSGANFTGADLSEADLSRADCTGANFFWAKGLPDWLRERLKS